ncbi:glycosyltransferase family 4 protein [Croceicoccus naphthovorans]|uniref:Glycosyl transferase family 1 n=1 Tax=Croceicoccus naphthovorans TaxID=1348774 RepID=A0A0G3XCF0_9SPHN|nr:glycosyltransferase family 1 protein [Croceicoccus naphthovorans]AKM09230.1 hypothetical protein AB433_03395 [Croceicoccus naphthovorans]
MFGNIANHIGGRLIHLNARFTGQPMTGVQRVAYELGRRLITTRTDAVTVAPEPPRPDYAMPVEVVPGLSGHLWEQVTLRRHLGPQDVLVGLGGTGPVGLRRQIVMIHDVNYLLGPDGFSRRFRVAYRVLQGALARQATICTVSHWSAREIARAFGIDASRIEVIYNAADHILEVEPDRSAPERLGIAARPYALCVGSANPNKNFATALAAYAALDNPAFDLVIVGGGDPRIFGDEIGMAKHPRLHRLSRINDAELRAVIEGAAAFLMPSLLEGFGIPAIEAMALGTPVIAAKASALPEVCGEAALLVDPLDVGEMGCAMLAVTGDAQLAQRMIAKGRLQAASYAWDRSARRLSGLVDRVAQGATTSR